MVTYAKKIMTPFKIFIFCILSVFAELTEDDLSITCELVKQGKEHPDWRYVVNIYSDFDAAPFDPNHLDNAKYANLTTKYTNYVKNPRLRANLWNSRVERRPSLILIFTSEEYVAENFDSPRTLSIPERTDVDSKIHGFYIITEKRIKTVRKCSTDEHHEHYSLEAVFKNCGYAYNTCLCDTNGERVTSERCGDISRCFMDEYEPDGFVCDGCSSKLWTGNQCDHSILLCGLLSITVIASASLCGAIMVPFQSSKYYPDIMGCMIALAIGCLTGDAVLHLIPYLYNAHGHSNNQHPDDHDDHAAHDYHDYGDHDHHDYGDHDDHDHDHHEHGSHGHAHQDHEDPASESDIIINRGLTILAGFYLYYLLNVSIGLYQKRKDEKRKLEKSQNGTDCETAALEIKKYEEVEEQFGGHGHSHNGEDIAMVGWMIIIADGLHNFADGLAIAAAFLTSYATGMGTVLAVFFHELPHELGDFAVLLSSGMSVKQAMFWNFLSASTCFLGFFAGLALADAANFNMFILGITAGAFLYIALVNMLPEITSQKNKKHFFRSFIFQQVGFISGAFIMTLIAKYESYLVAFF